MYIKYKFLFLYIWYFYCRFIILHYICRYPLVYMWSAMVMGSLSKCQLTFWDFSSLLIFYEEDSLDVTGFYSDRVLSRQRFSSNQHLYSEMDIYLKLNLGSLEEPQPSLNLEVFFSDGWRHGTSHLAQNYTCHHCFHCLHLSAPFSQAIEI